MALEAVREAAAAWAFVCVGARLGNGKDDGNGAGGHKGHNKVE